ncbi:hypothetical protein C8T65DRAFT_790739 [Cerioporus squamosus]|nr:hypothetical protein C8T65DRAFT_790739 [Cerioporus squamosus]
MAAHIPPAPVLSPEAFLIVFVHHTAPPAYDPVFGNCERLHVLGQSMLRAAYTAAVLQRSPNMCGQDLEQHFDERLPDFVVRWVTAYGWRQMMRAVPPHVNLHDPQETMRIFETYVGAVVAQQPRSLNAPPGHKDLFEWIQALVETP